MPLAHATKLGKARPNFKTLRGFTGRINRLAHSVCAAQNRASQRASPMTPTPNTPDTLELERHRPHLVKFALLQLRDAAAAEDAVQETLLAAIQGAERFSGNSTVRTWLIGILKHKIIDHHRRASREQPLREDDSELATDDLDAVFAPDGHFAQMPANWGNPQQALEQSRFYDALERCMNGLPKNTARVFMLREVHGMPTDDICKELAISSTNCWVLLYRARMSLRACLEAGWFGNSQDEKPGKTKRQ